MLHPLCFFGKFVACKTRHVNVSDQYLDPSIPSQHSQGIRTRNVVIEFPDYASALACYRSPEYQENIKVRLPHSTVDLIVIEGYDGPQP